MRDVSPSVTARFDAIRNRLRNPMPPLPTPEEIREREYREHKDSLTQYDVEYVPWDPYWDEAYNQFRNEIGLNSDLVRARLRVVRSQDARELCEFFEPVKAYLFTREFIHENLNYDE